MRLSFEFAINFSRDDEATQERETDVYTSAELQAASGVPTAMRPIGFVPDDYPWEGKR